jgi:hypothetical protein
MIMAMEWYVGTGGKVKYCSARYAVIGTAIKTALAPSPATAHRRGRRDAEGAEETRKTREEEPDEYDEGG